MLSPRRSALLRTLALGVCFGWALIPAGWAQNPLDEPHILPPAHPKVTETGVPPAIAIPVVPPVANAATNTGTAPAHLVASASLNPREKPMNVWVEFVLVPHTITTPFNPLSLVPN